MPGETVTYSLEAVLTRIEGKLDTLQKDVTDVKVGLATLTEKVGGMDKRLEKVESEQATMLKAISDLQGFRSLILPMIVGVLSAVIGAIVTVVFRLVFMSNN
jgi:type II secretory pathway component PulF